LGQPRKIKFFKQFCLIETINNLLKNQDHSLSEQEQQIKDYQNLLRTNEQKLKKAGEIINEKTNQLDKVEETRSELEDKLEQSEEKITQLDTNLVNSQTKIQELKTKIKELEQTNPNSSELIRLKQELASCKASSQAEINNLKNQLQSAKLKEESLNQKIKELSNKKTVKTEIETTTDKSYWERVKTPLIAVGGILAFLVIINYFKKKN
jgi:chromosome segregation ATPase